MVFDLIIKDNSSNCINAPGIEREQDVCHKLRYALEVYPDLMTNFKYFAKSDDCDFSKFPTKDKFSIIPEVCISIMCMKSSYCIIIIL